MNKRWLALAAVLSTAGCDTSTQDPPDSPDDPGEPDEHPPYSGDGDAPPECGDGDGVPGPDLVLEVNQTGELAHFTSRTFEPNDCLIYEGCVQGDGKRKLLELSFDVRNVGNEPVELGVPWQSELFYQSLCQDGYVLDGFVSARLLDGNTPVNEALLSTSCIAKEDGVYTCALQGLAAGEASTQPRSQCDFMDVTTVPPGDYTLELTVNPNGKLDESNLDNNTLRVAVEVPDCDGTVCGDVCCPEGVACENDVCMVPDLRVNATTAEESITVQYRGFAKDSCEIEEQCVGGPGRRRLLMFEGRIENWGPGDLSPGEEANNPAFEFSACHEHYHFKDFTSYRLVTEDGSVAASGHKQSFCLISMDPVGGVEPAPWGTHPEGEEGGCNHLYAGWADIYGAGTDCQWVDITDVPEGDYYLELAVNPLGRIPELALDNNIVRIPYHVSAPPICTPTSEQCDNGVDDDCDGFTDWEDEQDCEQPCFADSSEYCGDLTDNDCDGEVDEGCTVTDGGLTCADAIELGSAASTSVLVELGADPSPELPASCGASGGAVYLSFSLDSEQVVHLTTQARYVDSGGGDGDAGDGDTDGDGDTAPRPQEIAHGDGDGDGDGDGGAPEPEPEPELVDSVLSLFSGDCASNAKLACEDQSCGNARYFEQFLGKLPAGRYTVVVRAKQLGQTGRVLLDYAHFAAAGLTIADHPGIYHGSTAGSSDGTSACGYIEGGSDHSYLVAACPETQVVASTCGTASFDTILTSRQFGTGYMECSEDYNSCSDARGATLTTYNSTLLQIDVDSASSDESGEYDLFLSF